MSEQKHGTQNEQDMFYNKLSRILELTDNPTGETDMDISNATARDLLSNLINGEASDSVKEDLKVAYDKIKEAHLWLKNLAEILARYD